MIRLVAVTVGAVMTPRSVAVDPAGERLYVAVSTNTHLRDLVNAVRPVLIGRMF